MKIFVVCGCGNVLGCQQDGVGNKWCETTQPGDEKRSFGCDKNQFFECTLEKDILNEDGLEGQHIILEGVSCRHCPDDSYEIPEEERGPIAMMSC